MKEYNIEENKEKLDKLFDTGIKFDFFKDMLYNQFISAQTTWNGYEDDYGDDEKQSIIESNGKFYQKKMLEYFDESLENYLNLIKFKVSNEAIIAHYELETAKNKIASLEEENKRLSKLLFKI